MKNQTGKMRLIRCLITFLGLATIQPAFAQHGLLFDGSNCDVSLNNSSGLNLGNSFTLEAWVYPETFTAHQDIIYKWSTGYPDQRSYLLQLNNDQLDFAFSTNGLTPPISVYSTTRLTTDTWTHVAGVYDGTQLSLFIDGKKDASTWQISGLTSCSGTAPVFIGGTSAGSYEPFNGAIDEVRISNTARYTNDFPVPTTEFVPDANTLVLLHMNEGSGTATANAGSSGGYGILNGGVSWGGGAPIQVPEPSTWAMVGLGLSPLLVFRRGGHR